MRLHAFGVAVIVAGMFSTALAHETWMMPSHFAAKVGDEVRIDLSSGMAFPQLESPIQLHRISKARYRLTGGQADITQLEVSETSLVLRQGFPKSGLATIWLELKPRDIELTDDKVAEYLDEIDATSEIRSLWEAQKGRVAWKETYTKHAKTFVVVGDARIDSSWATSVGSALEFVPTSTPVDIGVGTDMTVELRHDSKPLPGAPVGLLIEGAAERVFRTTDDDGKATFSMARKGRAMLFTVLLKYNQEKDAWTSDFCTMTFEVRSP